jgi:hypothetical protein
MTIWRVRIACWIPNATNIHLEYVILIAFPLQQWLQERASVLPYTYTDCLVNSLSWEIQNSLYLRGSITISKKLSKWTQDQNGPRILRSWEPDDYDEGTIYNLTLPLSANLTRNFCTVNIYCHCNMGRILAISVLKSVSTLNKEHALISILQCLRVWSMASCGCWCSELALCGCWRKTDGVANTAVCSPNLTVSSRSILENIKQILINIWFLHSEVIVSVAQCLSIWPCNPQSYWKFRRHIQIRRARRLIRLTFRIENTKFWGDLCPSLLCGTFCSISVMLCIIFYLSKQTWNDCVWKALP